MPAYELYVDTLRRGALKEKGKQLRVVIGKDRNTSKVVNLWKEGPHIYLLSSTAALISYICQNLLNQIDYM